MTTTDMGIDEAHRAIAAALLRYTRETGLELKAEMFRVHVHPDQLAHWRSTVNSWTAGMLSQIIQNNDFFGFKIEADETVEPGHPVLKCIWEMTL